PVPPLQLKGSTILPSSCGGFEARPAPKRTELAGDKTFIEQIVSNKRLYSSLSPVPQILRAIFRALEGCGPRKGMDTRGRQGGRRTCGGRAATTFRLVPNSIRGENARLQF